MEKNLEILRKEEYTKSSIKDMDEKEIDILKFIYIILTDNRNQNRYCTTVFGNLNKDRTIRLDDCLSYIENKLLESE